MSIEQDLDSSRKRIVDEAKYHDQRISNFLAGDEGNERASQAKYYWATEMHDIALWRLIESLSRRRDVLEIGCFKGIRTVQIGSVAKSIIGLDISAEAAKLTGRRLVEEGINFGATLVANAERLPFPDSSFDVVFGTSIIHHLDIGRFVRELHRVLKPGGYAVFREPLGHNPLINLYRWRTPGARTEDEHPLLRKDLATLNDLFDIEESHYFGLSSLLATPFRGVFGGALMRDLLGWVDSLLLKASWLKHYAWQVNLVLRK